MFLAATNLGSVKKSARDDSFVGILRDVPKKAVSIVDVQLHVWHVYISVPLLKLFNLQGNDWPTADGQDNRGIAPTEAMVFCDGSS